MRSTLDRKLYDDRNPTLPEPCKCDESINNSGTCVKCGRDVIAPTAPPRLPAPRPACAPARIWTREEIVRAIKIWVARHGAAPKTEEWTGRHRDRDFPEYQAVTRTFGSWKAGLVAAGLPAPRRGRKPRNGRDSIRDL